MRKKENYLSEIIQELFKNIFGNNVVLATILISILPIIELKGAIPFAMSSAFWGLNSLSPWQAFFYAFIGSSAVVPLIALAFIPTLKWLKKTKIFSKFAINIENKILKKSKKFINQKSKAFEEDWRLIDNQENKKQQKKILGVFSFVAIPLPLTGVWTGTCISVLIGLNFKQTVSTVILGNLCAGFIMTTISIFFPNHTNIIFIVFLFLFAILFLCFVAKNIFDIGKNNKQKSATK